MQRLKIDMNEFTGAKPFKSKDGTDYIAIPIDANSIYRGEKALYCSLTLMDKPNKFGDDGFVIIDIGKERRDSGEKSPILGNWRNLGTRSPNQNQAPPPSATATADALDEDDDIPF